MVSDREKRCVWFDFRSSSLITDITSRETQCLTIRLLRTVCVCLSMFAWFEFSLRSTFVLLFSFVRFRLFIFSSLLSSLSKRLRLSQLVIPKVSLIHSGLSANKTRNTAHFCAANAISYSNFHSLPLSSVINKYIPYKCANMREKGSVHFEQRFTIHTVCFCQVCTKISRHIYLLLKYVFLHRKLKMTSRNWTKAMAVTKFDEPK